MKQLDVRVLHAMTYTERMYMIRRQRVLDDLVFFLRAGKDPAKKLELANAIIDAMIRLRWLKPEAKQFLQVPASERLPSLNIPDEVPVDMSPRAITPAAVVEHMRRTKNRCEQCGVSEGEEHLPDCPLYDAPPPDLKPAS